MKLPISTALFLGLTTLGGLALAADHAGMEGHAHGNGDMMTQSQMSDGEIKKINADKGMITIKHGPLHSLGMGPMTMSFNVADMAMLEKHAPGEKIRFMAQSVDGKLTVTHIEAAK